MKIQIENDALMMVNGYVRATDTEVGGLFTVTKEREGEFLIHKFYLLDQEVSGTSVDFKGEDLAELIEKAAVNGELDMLRGSWHSHPKFGVYFSSIDEGAIDKYRKNNPELPWLVSLCLNQKGEIAARVDIFDSCAISHITFEEVSVEFSVPEDILDKAKEEVDEVITEKKWGWGKNKNSWSKNNKSSSYDGSDGGGKKSLLESKPIHDLTDDEWREIMEEEYSGYGGSF